MEKHVKIKRNQPIFGWGIRETKKTNLLKSHPCPFFESFPSGLNQWICEISKIKSIRFLYWAQFLGLLYKYHYRYLTSTVHEKLKFLFTEPESLIYLFQGIDPSELFHKERAEYFNYASYPATHKCFDPENNKVFGKLKDNANAEQILDVVGLRPKMLVIYLRNIWAINIGKSIRQKEFSMQ